MKIYITGLPSGYEVEHLVRLFYPMAPLTLTAPEDGEDCVRSLIHSFRFLCIVL